MEWAWRPWDYSFACYSSPRAERTPHLAIRRRLSERALGQIREPFTKCLLLPASPRCYTLMAVIFARCPDQFLCFYARHIFFRAWLVYQWLCKLNFKTGEMYGIPTRTRRTAVFIFYFNRKTVQWFLKNKWDQSKYFQLAKSSALK